MAIEYRVVISDVLTKVPTQYKFSRKKRLNKKYAKKYVRDEHQVIIINKTGTIYVTKAVYAQLVKEGKIDCETQTCCLGK